jgi:hypothetical protein
MKQPRDIDFEIKHQDSKVIVIFQPTGSRYSYSMLDKSRRHGAKIKIFEHGRGIEKI